MARVVPMHQNRGYLIFFIIVMNCYKNQTVTSFLLQVTSFWPVSCSLQRTGDWEWQCKCAKEESGNWLVCFFPPRLHAHSLALFPRRCRDSEFNGLNIDTGLLHPKQGTGNIGKHEELEVLLCHTLCIHGGKKAQG